jgi:hypothetical protein
MLPFRAALLSGVASGGGGPSSDTSFEISGTGTSTHANTVAVMVFRGVDPTTPMDVTRTTASAANGGVPNPPAITPITSGAVIVAMGVGTQNAGTTDFGSSDLDNFLVIQAAGFGNMTGMGSKNWTSGAFDPAAFSGGNTAISMSWCACTIALRPASGETITYVGGKVAGFAGGTSMPQSVSLTDLAGGSDSAPQPGDLIVVCYGATSGLDVAIGINSPAFVEVVELFRADSLSANLSANYRFAA